MPRLSQDEKSNVVDAGTPLLDPWAHQVAPAPKPRFGVGAAVGAVLVVALNAGLALGVVALVQSMPSRTPPPKVQAAVRDEFETRRRFDVEPSAPGAGPQAAPNDPRHPKGPSPQGTVPEQTREIRVGEIVVVDVGYKELTLKGALLEQLRVARQNNEQVLVMIQQASCNPCEGVITSLQSSMMQRALGKIRLVRVDTEVFTLELDRLKMPHKAIPGFALLNADATAKDIIDGGEWDEDIAENIAPVLGPFVRGEYNRRRKPDHKPPQGGVFL